MTNLLFNEELLAGAHKRIQMAMGGVFVLSVFPVWMFYGRAMGIGFVLGAAVSCLSFLWLKQSVHAFTEQITHPEQRSRGAGIVFRFLLRYILMAGVAYAMIFSSPSSVRGLLAGLMLSVAALLLEAGFEAFCALRTDF